MVNPMVQLACMVMPQGPAGQVVDVAVEAERLGFGRIWIPDEGIAARECWVTLGAVAVATSVAQIGTGITNVYTRHPAVTAAAVATLDELSNGRAALGLGAGGGLTLGPLAVKRHRPLAGLRDLISTSRALWSGETVDHQGHTGGFSEAQMGYGRPDIPIWLAGRGPKLMNLAGELADGFIASFIHKDLIGTHLNIIRTEAANHGRPCPRLAYTTMLAITDEDRNRAKAALSFRLVDSPSDVKSLIGLDARTEAKIRQNLATGGPQHAARFVRDEWVDAFVISGSADQCRHELAALVQRHQIDEFQVPLNDLGAAGDDLARAALIATGQAPQTRP